MITHRLVLLAPVSSLRSKAYRSASGSQRGTEDWEIAFKFAASPNATDLTVGDITGIEKKGWEYLWVRYADAEDEETLVKQPVAARSQ